MAKGLSSGYLPISGSIVNDKVWAVLEDGTDQYGPFGHGWTYSGHALGAAAALANLDIIEREDLIANTNSGGGYFQEQLHGAFDEHPLVGEVRGVTLLAALEFVAHKGDKVRFDPVLKVGPRVAERCLQNGMIARAMPHQDTLGFAPAMVATKTDIDDIVAITRKSLDEVMDALVREGVWKG